MVEGIFMEPAKAIEILTALADGADPTTGEAFPPDSPYHTPEILRALFQGIKALERVRTRTERLASRGTKAGSPWSQQEQLTLLAEVAAGKTLAELASCHGRTTGAIIARLVRLGQFPSRDEARAVIGREKATGA